MVGCDGLASGDARHYGFPSAAEAGGLMGSDQPGQNLQRCLGVKAVHVDRHVSPGLSGIRQGAVVVTVMGNDREPGAPAAGDVFQFLRRRQLVVSHGHNHGDVCRVDAGFAQFLHDHGQHGLAGRGPGNVVDDDGDRVLTLGQLRQPLAADRLRHGLANDRKLIRRGKNQLGHEHFGFPVQFKFEEFIAKRKLNNLHGSPLFRSVSGQLKP